MPYSREPMGICERCGTVRPFSELRCERCGGRIQRWEGQLPNPPTPDILPPESPPEKADSTVTSSREASQVEFEAITKKVTVVNSSAILTDRGACIRIIQALKAGRAPKEGVRFLSVGIDEIVEQLRQAFSQALQNKPQTFWLIGDYGEGKSHLLRLIAALAEEHRFAWAYVVHDKDQLIGLHKPAWLFRHILWELQWEYPSLNLWHNVMTNPPYYDRSWRYTLPKELKDLTERLRWQGYSGLVICLDELENCFQLYWNQHRPAYETLIRLLFSFLDCPLILCFGLTESGLELLEVMERVKDNLTERIAESRLELLAWHYYVGDGVTQPFSSGSSKALKMPSLSDSHALELAQRIFQLHAAAFDWQPTIEVQQVAQHALALAKSNSSGQWRIFVQSVVAQLEVEHQRVYSHQPSVRRTPPPIKPPTPIKPSIQPQPPKPPTLQFGDKVEIIKGPFRGWRGIVERVKDLQAEVILDGRHAMRTWQPLDALKKLR